MATIDFDQTRAELEHRLKMLQGRFVEPEFIRDYYGLDSLDAHDLLHDVNRYRKTMAPGPENDAAYVDRYALEGFFQARRLLPLKWAALTLGLNEELFRKVLAKRYELPTPLREEYVWYECLVKTSFAEDVRRVLPQLRNRSFYDHRGFCQFLHPALQKALKISDAEMAEGTAWCATDQALREVGLGDDPPRVAEYFDCLTCAPLSAAHCMWLELKKPRNLPPDRCSKLTFVCYPEQIGDLYVGTRPPDDLSRYERYRQHLAGAR